MAEDETAPVDEKPRFRFDLPPKHNISVQHGEQAEAAESALLGSEERLKKIGWYHGVRQEQISSPTMRLMQDRLDEERREAYMRLAVTDPANAKRITELQNAIWRADVFEIWIRDFLAWGNREVQEIRREMSGEQRTD